MVNYNIDAQSDGELEVLNLALGSLDPMAIGAFFLSAAFRKLQKLEPQEIQTLLHDFNLFSKTIEHEAVNGIELVDTNYCVKD